MRSSSIVAMTAAAALCLSAGLANAQNPGQVAFGESLTTPLIWNLQFGDGAPKVTGTFTDLFTFNNPVTPGVQAIGQVNSVSLGGGMTAFDMQIVDVTNSNALIADLGNGLSIANFALPLANTITNDMFGLLVTGTVSPNATSSYTGNLQMSAVPEPKTYAMLLAGLGLLAFTARRRKTSFF